jgi:hypothetical protein
MAQIGVNTLFRKEADFQRVLYYKKIAIRLLNWEPQMYYGLYRDVHPIRRNSMSHCNVYCKDYLYSIIG